jgi:TonB-dependent receptor
MDLNNIAGKVNVNSVTAFTRGRDSLSLSVQGSMHDQRGEFSPKFTLVGTKLLADDTFGIAVSLSHEERATEVNQILSEDGMRYIRVSQPQMGPNGGALSSLEYMNDYYNSGIEEADPYIDENRMLTPLNFEVRQDESVRTRSAFTLDFGWRPTDNSEYYLRYAYTDYTDEELTLREFYRYAAGDARFIGFVDPDTNFFAVTNADLQHRVLIEKANDLTTSYSLGGKNVFADAWTVDYAYSHSESERENPNDRRAQFRIRALPMYGQLYKDDIIARTLTVEQMNYLAQESGASFDGANVPGMVGYGGGLFGGYQAGERFQPDMAFDNLRLEKQSRYDQVEELTLNLRGDIDWGPMNYIKSGVQIKGRERRRLRDVFDGNIADFSSSYCGDNLECQSIHNTRMGQGFDGTDPFASFTPRNPRFDHDIITVADAERLIAAARVIPENLFLDQPTASNRSDNYELYEDSFAAYAMAEFQLAENATLIAGARYSWTEYGSTGWLTLRHDRFINDDGFTRDIALPLTDPETGGFAKNEYDGIYPGIHLRYEPRDDMVVRSALWTNFNRPGFGDASAGAKFSDRVELCRDVAIPDRPRCSDNLKDDGGAPNENYDVFLAENLSLAPFGNDLELGNTDLKAMEALNFDASVSWYGDGGRFFEVGIFYKKITDYIVEVRGLSIPRSELPLTVQQAIDQIDSSNGGTSTLTDNIFIIPDDFVFHNVDTAINGDKATVYGAEISYSHFFDNGLFAMSNMTLLQSSASPGASVRADETPLPFQADVTVNLVLGWENDDFSVRGIANYRSEVLTAIGTCSQADIDRDMEWARLNDVSNSDALPGATGDGTVYDEHCQRWADEFHDDIFSLDFKATYNWRDFKFYFDVLNITEDVDVFYYRGNEHSGGNVLQFSEGIGRTYQIGINYKFW